MKISKYNFSDLDPLQIDEIVSLTIKESSFLRYLNNFIDARDEDDVREMKKYDYTIFLAEDLKIEGWSMAGLDMDFGEGDEGVVHLFISEPRRGQGLGLKLFTEALKEIKIQEFDHILTYAHDDTSKEFFESKSVQNLCKKERVKITIIE